MKPELRSKIDQAVKCSIIGDIRFSDEELKEIRDELENRYWEKLQYGMNATEMLKLHGKELLVLLINYARSWDSSKETHFWTGLFDKALDDPEFSQAKLYDCFEDIFGKGRVFKTPAGKRSFYSTFLYHALAPQSSYKELIRMLWRELYLDPEMMNGSYSPDDPLIPYTAHWLRTHFSALCDDIEQDFQISTSTYAIKSGFKYAFMQYDEEEMTNLLQRLLRGMDAWWYNETPAENRSCVDEMLIEALTDITRQDDLQKRHSRTAKRQQALPDLMRVNPLYQMEDDKGPLLVIPEARVFREDINTVEVSVYLGKYPITTVKRNVIGQDLRRRLEKIELRLLPLLYNAYAEAKSGRQLKLRLVMTAGGETIIDTGEKLYRSYLLFDGTNETQRLMCRSGKQYYVLSLDDNLSESMDGIEANIPFPRECRSFYVIYPKDGESIHTLDRTTVFTNETTKSFVHLMGKKAYGLRLLYEDECYPVFNSIPELQLTTAKDISNCGLYTNGKLLGPLKSYTVQRGANQWTIEIPDNIDEDGVFDVVIRDMKTQQLIDRTVFGFAPNLQVQRRDNVCYGSRQSFSVIDGNGSVRELTFNRYGDPVVYDERFLASVDILRWRLDDGEWHTEEQQRPIWYMEAPLHNNVLLEIDIEALGNHQLQVLAGETPVGLKNGSMNCYRLGDAITETGAGMCDIRIVLDGKERYSLLTAAKQPLFYGKPDVFYEDGIITFDARGCFIGDTYLSPGFRLQLRPVDSEDDISVETGIYEQITAPEELVDNWYDCEIFLRKSILSTEETRIYSIDELLLGDPFRSWFNDEKLILTKTKYSEKAGNKPEMVKLNGLMLYDIGFAREEMGSYVYRAKLSGLQKRAMDVCFSWDGTGEDKPVIRLLSPDDEAPLQISVDAKKKVLCALLPCPEKGLYRCGSFYARLS